MTGRPIVVVGAGVAGCVVAATLARESSAPIVIVESGGSTDALFGSADRSLSFVDSLGRTSTSRNELLVRRTSAQDPKPYPAGRGVGGSGEINAMVASWGLASDVVSWGDQMPVGLDGLESWRDALATLPHDVRTAGEGEWGPMDAALVRACTAAGIRRHDALWNDFECPEGVGTVSLFARGNLRSTGVDAMLRPAVASGRVRIDRDSTAASVVMGDGFVRGIEMVDGRVVEARAIVMCAGSFGSVELLQQSGVLPDEVHGVQDHPAIALVTARPLEQQSVVSIGAIGRMAARGGVGNIHLVSMNATAPGARSHGAVLVALMDVESRGSIRRRPDGVVERNLNMLSTRNEAMTLVDAMRRIIPIVRDMERRLGTRFHLADRAEPVDWVADVDDDDVVSWLRSSAGVYAHAASSLPLGGEHLDRLGALRSVDGLWVADASVMPRLVAGNPTLAIAALARLVARNAASASAAN